MTENINPGQANHHTYQENFVQSKALFQKSLEGYQAAKKAQFEQQQEAFKKPMDEAYQVLQDSASQLVGANLDSAKAKLAADYAAFQQNDSDANIQKLQSDIKEMNP